MFKVVLHKRAARYLQRLSKSQKTKIKDQLKELQAEPINKPHVKQMAGDWKGYYRMRSGNTRIIFWIDHANNIIYVDHIGPRGDIYK